MFRSLKMLNNAKRKHLDFYFEEHTHSLRVCHEVYLTSFDTVALHWFVAYLKFICISLNFMPPSSDSKGCICVRVCVRVRKCKLT